MGALIIRLPFEGFYESRYSQEVDHWQETDAEHFAERDREEQAKELQLSDSEFGEILFDCADYSNAYLSVAHAYVDAFQIWASGLLALPLGLKFESMDSPREYNFTTDRVYAFIDLAVVEALFQRSVSDGHAALAKQMAETFSSYDGFISSYSNRLHSWLEKPVAEWDHNELCTLLEAVLMAAGAEQDWGWEVFEIVTNDDGLSQEWSACVDWQKFDERVAELREEKAEELRLDRPDYVPPYRCPATPDLFRREA